MPIYEYACGNCDSQFELLQKVSDAPASDCPHCDKPDVKKLVSATSFRLKGSGWYETDFKDKSPAGQKKASTQNKSSDKKTTPKVSKEVKKAKTTGDSK